MPPVGPVDLVPRPEGEPGEGTATATVVAPPSPGPGGAGPERTPPEPDPGEGGDGAYRGRYAASRPSWWWRWGFAATLVLALVAVPVLVWVGTRVVLGSTDGRIIETVTDPSAPGWQAAVEPTPVQGVALVDPQGGLDSVALLVATTPERATVIEVPGGVLVDQPGQGQVPLSTVYATQLPETFRGAVEQVVGTGVPAIDVVSAAQWADLVAPVGSLQIDNPDTVTGGGAVGARYARGPVTVPAAQVWDYLSATGVNENPLNRLLRQEAFWQAWLGAVGRDPAAPGIVPGEVDVGLGRAVRALAGHPLDVEVLPVQAVPGGGSAATYAPVPADVAALVARTVPWPAGPEGTRVHLTVLDGTGHLDHGVAAARALAAAGAQIDKVGNAAELGQPTTQLIFSEEVLRPEVDRLREVLGVGEVIQTASGGGPGVTVVLGEDYRRAVGGG